MANIITDIENALITQVKNTKAFKKVEPFSGDVRDILSRVRNWPAAYVAYVGSSFSPDTSEKYDREMDYQVIIFAKDLRGGTAARRKSQGMYDLIETVRTALSGKTNDELNLSFDVIISHPDDDRPLLLEKERVIWSLLFKVKTVWR